MDEFPSTNKAYWKRQQKKAMDCEAALKIIRAWAELDIYRKGQTLYIQRTLDPKHVIQLCDSVLSR